MIVTSCIIPILVLLFFVWIVKILFSVDIVAGRNKKTGLKNRTVVP